MNKRLIAVFVCMALFVLTLVVGAVLFTVSDVNILLASDENIAFDKSKILEASGIKKGQNVFSIDKEAAVNNIEKQFPAFNVQVERTFPNKVRIQLKTRIPVFKIKIANTDNYAVLDRDLKIIDVVSGDGNAYGDDKLVVVSGYEYSGADNPCGDFITDDSNDISSLKDIILSLEKLGVVNQRIPAVFSNFDIFSNKRVEMQTVLGIKIVIRTDLAINDQANPIEYQCDLLYSHYYSKMSGDEREQNKYLYLGQNGVLPIVSANLDFDL